MIHNSLQYGGGSVAGKTYPVMYLNPDGSILSSQDIVSGQNAVAPSNPTKSLCTFHSWSGNGQNITGETLIGANYTVTDGKLHLFIELNAVTGLSPTLQLYKANTALLTVNWGDTNSDTSTTNGAISINHTYAVAGAYEITVECASAFSPGGNGTNTTAVFGTGTYTWILKKVYIPAICASISKYAFYHCEELNEVVLSHGITTLDTGAFNYCYKLGTVIIPNTVTTIGNSCFANSQGIKYVVNSTGLTTLGTYVFSYCNSLEGIVIPSGVTILNTNTFNYASNMRYIRLSDGITSIGDSCFKYCYSLEEINIPTSLQTISNSAFQSCSSLRSIILPNSVTSIGTLAFQDCWALESVVMSTGITAVPASCFKSCYSLRSLSFVSGVNSVAAEAFSGCLKEIEYIFNATTPPTLANTNAFTGITGQTKIYVPDANVDAYKAATNWITYANYIVGLSTRPS